MTDPFLSKRAKTTGKDGIIITHEDGSFDEIIAFTSYQIKSVNNVGSFDINNKDITK